MTIPVVVQYRHVHLSPEDRKQLFGDIELGVSRALAHKGQVVYEQTVQVVGPNGKFERVSVLGPDRDQTQVELSSSDAFALGLKASVRISGDLERSASCKLIGPNGEVNAKSSTIIPVRHLHCNPQTAEQLGVTHHAIVSLAIEQTGNQVLSNVLIRIHPTFALEFHLTKDEAAEHWIQTGDAAKIL